MFNALNTITLNPTIRAWLKANDPKAYEQVLVSLGMVRNGSEYPSHDEFGTAIG